MLSTKLGQRRASNHPVSAEIPDRQSTGSRRRVESENPRLSGTRHGPDPAARLGEGARIGQSSGVDVGENEDATSGREVVDHSKGGIDGFTGEVVRYPFPYEYRPDNGIEAGGKQRIGEPVVLEIDGHVGNVSAVEAQTVDD